MAFEKLVKKIFKSKTNFKYLDELIHSGTKEIVLESDIIIDEEEISEYENGIKIDLDDITIDGNGYAIDACRKSRIFECTGKNITLKNITLKNGLVPYDGGAILNKGDLTIKESTFCRNRAIGKTIHGDRFIKNSTGGAIENNGNLTVIKSTFSKNEAIGGIKYYQDFTLPFSGYGGAIYNNGELTITESSFNENVAKKGGAICYESEDNVNISNCTFNANEKNDTELHE